MLDFLVDELVRAVESLDDIIQRSAQKKDDRD